MSNLVTHRGKLLTGILLTGLLFNALYVSGQTREIDSLRNLLSKTKVDTSSVNFYIQISNAFYKSYKLDSIEKYISIAQDICEKQNLETKKAQCLIVRALLDYEKHEYTNCRQRCAIAIEIGSRLNNAGIVADAYHRIGWSYHAEDNYSLAIETLYVAAKKYEEAKDSINMLYTLTVVGAVYSDYGNNEEGLKIIRETYRLQEHFGHKPTLIYTYYILAGMLTRMEHYEEALIYNEKLQKLALELEDLRRLEYSYLNYGNLYLGLHEKNKGDFLSAKESLLLAEQNTMSAQKIFEQIENNYGGVNILVLLGQINFKKKEFAKARNYFIKCLALSAKIKNKYETRDSYRWMAKIDSATGDFKNAIKNYKNYILYRDSIVNEESTSKNTKLKLQYEFDKKEDSLRQKQLITQTKLDSQEKQKNFYLTGAGLLAFLSLFVFLNFRNQKKINRLMDDAHAKEKAELELQSLRAQLNPHFMFNSLNAIQELILKEENEKSQTYLARFAKLLRMLLENADKPFIPLQREIDFLRLYLSLENLRIPDLKFSIDVDPEVDSENTQIPNMILQPYIENAIWHGLSHKEKDKQLRIRISQSNGATQYEIEDNGVGRKKAAELKSLYRREHKSKGMELLSKRFKLLATEHGSDIKTEITDSIGGTEIQGTKVLISVPLILH